MFTFKDVAYEILKEANRPLHSKEITKRALERGLVTSGETPEATMNAQLVVDINKNGVDSRFIKTAPSTFFLNEGVKQQNLSAKARVVKKYNIAPELSSKQKGDIAEARIAELVTLYGDTSLSCYKPISDDEGIDLIVKQKGSLKTLYIQVKSRFGDEVKSSYTATVKKKSVTDNHKMALVFCFFDTAKGDVWDYLWFVPAPEFISKANDLNETWGFVAGHQHKESNKWDKYLIEKNSLSENITKSLERL